MQEKITAALIEIAGRYGVEIISAVEAGSRAWGFHSPDSDYDVRFIYRRPLAWYLSITERRDVIEPSYDFPLDINGWDLRKALYQIYKGNPAFLEWLNSPLVYQDNGDRERLQALAQKYFNPRTAIYHYLHMADGNYRGYLKAEQVKWKKYLYVIRPILACMYVEEHHSMPPVNFSELAHRLSAPDIPHLIIDELIARKMRCNEADTTPRIDALNLWLKNKIDYFMEKARLIERSQHHPDDLNEFFMEKTVQIMGIC